MENGHEYVDLGLPSGTLWATCNIGATNPEDYGWLYAWGEIETKSSYTWQTYKYGTENNLTKYNKIDGKTELEDIDDVAVQKWGGNWRMPTALQMWELYTNCYWVYTECYNQVRGYIVYKAKTEQDKGKKVYYDGTPSENYDIEKDTHIFLPQAGWIDGYSYGLPGVGSGNYYARDIYARDIMKGFVNFKYVCGFNFTGFDLYCYTPWRDASIFGRNVGRSIRAVCPAIETTPTAIGNVNASSSKKAVKTIENGKMVIIRDGVKHDITGRKL